MGNVLCVWNTLPAWPYNEPSDSRGARKKELVEMDKRRPELEVREEVTSKDQKFVHVYTSRELRRRRRLNITE